MKKLNVLALCAVLAPAYMLGIGSVAAEERDKSCETHQHAGETTPSDKEAEGKGTTSASTDDSQDNESQEPEGTDQSAGSGTAEGATAEADIHCGDYSNE